MFRCLTWLEQNIEIKIKLTIDLMNENEYSVLLF